MAGCWLLHGPSIQAGWPRPAGPVRRSRFLLANPRYRQGCRRVPPGGHSSGLLSKARRLTSKRCLSGLTFDCMIAMSVSSGMRWTRLITIDSMRATHISTTPYLSISPELQRAQLPLPLRCREHKVGRRMVRNRQLIGSATVWRYRSPHRPSLPPSIPPNCVYSDFHRLRGMTSGNKKPLISQGFRDAPG